MAGRLSEREIAALEGVRDGRAVRANDKGAALTRDEFGTAAAFAVSGQPRLVRIIPRTAGGPNLELTDAGRAALESKP